MYSQRAASHCSDSDVVLKIQSTGNKFPSKTAASTYSIYVCNRCYFWIFSGWSPLFKTRCLYLEKARLQVKTHLRYVTKLCLSFALANRPSNYVQNNLARPATYNSHVYGWNPWWIGPKKSIRHRDEYSRLDKIPPCSLDFPPFARSGRKQREVSFRIYRKFCKNNKVKEPVLICSSLFRLIDRILAY